MFWRSIWAAAFLIAFMVWRDGLRGTLKLVTGMGLPGIAVAVCFAIASTSFVVALAYTTVANIVLMQAGVPLIAALLAWIAFRENVAPSTWAAIAAVICGVAIMVSESFNGQVSPIGDGLALLIAFMFATATVITRRYAHVRVKLPRPVSARSLPPRSRRLLAGSIEVSLHNMGFLFAFGVLNLGLGLACFGIRSTRDTRRAGRIAGHAGSRCWAPIWVWWLHGEIPSARTVAGRTVVFLALLVHLGLEFRRQQQRPSRPGVSGIPAPR